jgi:polyphosphate kinase 2 (PPK2 family)
MHNRYGVLICLQGMDTSGKDSLIREVFKEFNSRVVVHSFKTPNSSETDYLWRHYLVLPEKGSLRYLTERIMKMSWSPECILNIMNENLPGMKPLTMLHLSFGKIECNKLIILKSILRKWNHYFKVLLHLSKEEQRQRLLRLEEKKNTTGNFR